MGLDSDCSEGTLTRFTMEQKPKQTNETHLQLFYLLISEHISWEKPSKWRRASFPKRWQLN